jgi:hypothetical protein
MWLDDIVKKLAEDNVINKNADNIAKAVDTLTQHQDSLATATADVISKERPNIERSIGAQVLSGQPTGLESIVQQLPQGQPMTVPGPVGGQTPQISGIGEGGQPDRLQQTVTNQGNFISRLPKEAGKFMQSVGYGMLDKPLGRDASTWDYLGKTVGQLARLNEGSGLGAGYTIPQGQTVTTENANKAVLPEMSTDLEIVNKKVDPKNKTDVDAAFRAMVRKYPTQYSALRAYFYPQSQTVNMGLDRSSIESAMNQG